jgi:phage-related protein
MNEKKIREALYYENHFIDFFQTLKPDVQKKVLWTIKLVESLDRVPEKYFKHLTNTTGLFELRIEVGSDIYRVFSFFDKGKLIIIINGFQKKTQKTPKKEIELAEKIKAKYFDELKTKKTN